MTLEIAKPRQPNGPWRALVLWASRIRLGGKIALTLMFLAVMAGAATYAALTADAPFGDPQTVYLLLNIDLVVVLGLGLIVARRIVALWVQRRQGRAGARLHVKFVTWFSDRVRTAVDESVVVASAYLEEHKQAIRGDILAMASDLNAVPIGSPEFQHLVELQTFQRNFSDAMVFDGFLNIKALTGLMFTSGLDKPSLDTIDAARRRAGEVQVMTSNQQDRVTALVKLYGYGDVFLYVARPIDPKVLAHINIAKDAAAKYAQAEGSRSSLQIQVWLMFIVVALLLLLAAVWLGLHFARQLVEPVSELIAAAVQVRSGDLSIRVKEPDAADEVSILSRTFNRMTSQLGSQRAELVEANRQLDKRRRFTETVLSGVSAGVIGLDTEGNITLANRSAVEFLGIEATVLTGRPLAEILP